MYRPEPLPQPTPAPWPRWAHILAVLSLTLAGILTGLYLE